MDDLCSSTRGGTHAMCVLAGMALVTLAIAAGRYVPRLTLRVGPLLAAAGMAMAVAST